MPGELLLASMAQTSAAWHIVLAMSPPVNINLHVIKNIQDKTINYSYTNEGLG